MPSLSLSLSLSLLVFDKRRVRRKEREDLSRENRFSIEGKGEWKK